jgi:hypothetical protein
MSKCEDQLSYKRLKGIMYEFCRNCDALYECPDLKRNADILGIFDEQYRDTFNELNASGMCYHDIKSLTSELDSIVNIASAFQCYARKKPLTIKYNPCLYCSVNNCTRRISNADINAAENYLIDVLQTVPGFEVSLSCPNFLKKEGEQE